jgi:hypothetical protein
MTDTPKWTVALARVALLGTLFHVFVWYVAFVFIQPELNPLYRYGSQYSLGRMGWLMKLAFFVWGGGMLALALAMAKGLDTAARSRTAIILFAVGGAGVFSRAFSMRICRFSIRIRRRSGLRLTRRPTRRSLTPCPVWSVFLA